MPGRHYATGHVNKKLIALVQIRATDPVAILIHCNYSCPFVQFVGKTISLRAICLEGSTERSDGNRVRSARICEVRTMCLEFSCKRAQSRTCSGYAECSRKSRRSGSTPQDMPQASPLLALVQIRATDPVAIYPLHLFVSIRAIRGQ